MPRQPQALPSLWRLPASKLLLLLLAVSLLLVPPSLLLVPPSLLLAPPSLLLLLPPSLLLLAMLPSVVALRLLVAVTPASSVPAAAMAFEGSAGKRGRSYQPGRCPWPWRLRVAARVNAALRLAASHLPAGPPAPGPWPVTRRW